MEPRREGAVPDPAGAPSPAGVLRPGDTCWRLERARRMAVLVDAADYFSALKHALLRARHQILLIGWDFDTRIRLEPDRRTVDGPDRLGRFLIHCVGSRPDVCVNVLKWRLSMVQAGLRGMTPLFVLDWMTNERLRYRLASDHPVGACHHQKIVVIDDALAFCGGIDMTTDRWDTPAHHDHDHFRRRPNGWRYGPFHDVTTAVDGEAARALGELGRRRWKSATGQDLPVPPPGSDPWPGIVRPRFRDVDVAIARTHPEYGDQEEVREIERLWLAAIASARRTIYIEAQYFASRRIGKALGRRLAEPDGPEVVVVTPLATKGWLEETAMGSARAHLLAHLREADRGGRFRIYTPRAERGRPIYVHAKVLVVDDRLLRVGSSNVNNRSMGFDTECDLAIEAPPGREDVTSGILDLRDGLVAEHLGRTVEEVRGAMAACGGSLAAAVEVLRQRPGRTLAPLDPPEPGAAASFIVENEILDPERVRSPVQSMLHRFHGTWRRHRMRGA